MYRDYDFSTIDTNILSSDIFKILISILIGIWLFALIILIVISISQWKIYKKAGKEGWEVLIPIYNTWVLFEISGLKGWYSLLIFIPVLGPFVFLIFIIMAYIKLSACFGKNPVFAVGLIFLPVVFFPILAFDKSEYKLIKEPVIKI